MSEKTKPNTGTDTGPKGNPRPFSKAEMDQILAYIQSKGGLAPTGAPPTTLVNCLANKGHGGSEGDRIYYPSGSPDMKTGKWNPGPAVCEICGTVGVD